jgi:hypothetical protein
VSTGVDEVVLGGDGEPVRYVRIEWGQEDALPFPFCVSVMGPAPECAYIPNVSIARGNVVLVDHGRTWTGEDLGCVPTLSTAVGCICEGRIGDVSAVPGRFYPTLSRSPVTWREGPRSEGSARELLRQDCRKATPQVTLQSSSGLWWDPRRDLVGSSGTDRHFVVEIDNDAVAHLRFGDGQLGARPAGGECFRADYRAGNGTAGNVGAESISRLVLDRVKVSGVSIRVRNPLPARGGVDPETVAHAKLFAPYLFRSTIERAIVASDYAELAERNTGVQEAAAELVWTGSWYEADVAIDPLGTESVPAYLLTSVAADLERYRRMGHDLHVKPAAYVPIDLGLEVCALEGYERAHVEAALLDAFSCRVLRGGVKGFFHPDNLTFGESVRLSVIIAAAQAVEGVECVEVTRLQRLFDPANHELENGLLPLGSHEVAMLDNDPNYPEHGRLVVTVHGGR